MSELVHAIVIMAHCHALAGFALGCGVNPEIDTPLGHTGMGKDGEVQLAKIPFCSNPALGIGNTPAQSDSESEPLSPVARSPTHQAMAESLVKHYIESKSVSLSLSLSHTHTHTHTHTHVHVHAYSHIHIYTYARFI